MKYQFDGAIRKKLYDTASEHGIPKLIPLFIMTVTDAIFPKKVGKDLSEPFKL